LESHVEWPVILFEIQGHAGNSAFVAAISFLETRRYHKGQIRPVRRPGATAMFLTAKNCLCFRSSVST